MIEGSGGLALQITLDRRVVVFGRGKVLPEHRFPTGGKKRPAATGAGGGAGVSSSPLAVVVEGVGEGGDGEDRGGSGGSGARSRWAGSARTRRQNA